MNGNRNAFKYLLNYILEFQAAKSGNIESSSEAKAVSKFYLHFTALTEIAAFVAPDAIEENQ